MSAKKNRRKFTAEEKVKPYHPVMSEGKRKLL